MATYTSLDHQALQQCLDVVGLGQLVDFTIPGHGIENTNYLLDVEPAAGVKMHEPGSTLQCVLTVYEMVPKHQVSIYTRCLKQWSEHLVVPKPLQEKPLSVPSLPEKFFLISTRLPGEHILQPSISNCSAIGEFLAKFHCIAQNTPDTLQGSRCLPWVLNYEPDPAVCPEADIAFFKQAQKLLQPLPELLAQCPQGWIHGDLFPDNALFQNDQLQGVIDFNNACCAPLLLDLCITLNAWSSQGVDSSSEDHFEAIMSAYTKVRELTELEKLALDKTLLASALRFWASRLDFVQETGGKPGKEPQEYRRLAHTYFARLS